MRREKNTLTLSSVQDQRENEDRTKAGPRPVQPIFWDRRSRFGPIDRKKVGLWPSLPRNSLQLHDYCYILRYNSGDVIIL